MEGRDCRSASASSRSAGAALHQAPPNAAARERTDLMNEARPLSALIVLARRQLILSEAAVEAAAVLIDSNKS
jgi:hypothetical protein